MGFGTSQPVPAPSIAAATIVAVAENAGVNVQARVSLAMPAILHAPPGTVVTHVIEAARVYETNRSHPFESPAEARAALLEVDRHARPLRDRLLALPVGAELRLQPMLTGINAKPLAVPEPRPPTSLPQSIPDYMSALRRLCLALTAAIAQARQDSKRRPMVHWALDMLVLRLAYLFEAHTSTKFVVTRKKGPRSAGAEFVRRLCRAIAPGTRPQPLTTAMRRAVKTLRYARAKQWYEFNRATQPHNLSAGPPSPTEAEWRRYHARRRHW